jgi:hypothetical protein
VEYHLFTLVISELAELWLTASAQHDKTVSYCLSVVQEKIKMQNAKCGLQNADCFCTIIKLKNDKSDQAESGEGSQLPCTFLERLWSLPPPNAMALVVGTSVCEFGGNPDM